jgi:hypothetical protein
MLRGAIGMKNSADNLQWEEMVCIRSEFVNESSLNCKVNY